MCDGKHLSHLPFGSPHGLTGPERRPNAIYGYVLRSRNTQSEAPIWAWLQNLRDWTGLAHCQEIPNTLLQGEFHCGPSTSDHGGKFRLHLDLSDKSPGCGNSGGIQHGTKFPNPED